MDSYQFHIVHYHMNTADLKPIEHYIYRELIDWYLFDEQPIPKDIYKMLKRLCLGIEDIQSLINVLTKFFDFDGSVWTHRKCTYLPDLAVEE